MLARSRGWNAEKDTLKARIEFVRATEHVLSQVSVTDVMRELRAAISYEFAALPRGGEVRIRSSNSDAVEAIHSFLAFQRSDHRAAGHGHDRQ